MIGDHIRTLKAGRWTHAIDCGDETVLVRGDDAQPPRVRRSYRPEFVAGAEAVEVVLHRERTFPAEEVVARAYSRIADPGLASMFRDSEAFAEWCTTGRLPAAAPNVAVSVVGVAARGASAPAPVAPVAAPAKTQRSAAGAKARRKAAAKAKPAPAARKAKPARSAKRGAKAKPARKAAKRTRGAKRGASRTAKRRVRR